MEMGQLPTGKITPPRSTTLFLRKKHLARLKNCQKSLIWVSGPAGSGKTSLVSQYLSRSGISSLWYQLDESDSDPAAFFYYLGLAVQKEAKGKKTDFPLLTPEYLLGLPAFVARYFEKLYNCLPPPLAVVLDNYQDISLGSPLHEMIARAAGLAPFGVRFFLVSRTSPNAPYSRMRIQGRMELLDFEYLRFFPEEIKELANWYGQTDRISETVEKLWEKTHGWAAGLIAILQTIKQNPLSQKAGENIASEELFDYFLVEIFNQIDENTRTFLLKTALLPFITPEMAEEVTGMRDTSRLLSFLCRENLFTVKSDSLEGAFQYHSLFRDFLVSRIRKSMGPGQLSDLRKKTAFALKNGGYADEALELFAKISSWDQVVELVISRAPAMIAQGRTQTLLNQIGLIPENLHQTQPILAYFKGVCLLAMNKMECGIQFELAFKGFSENKDVPGMFRAFTGAIEAVFFRRDDFSKMDPWIQWIDQFMGHDFASIPPEVEPMVVSAMVSAIAFRVPGHFHAQGWLERAQALVESHLPIAHRIQLAQSLHLCHIYMGSHGKACFLVNLLEQVIAGQALSPLAEIQWCLIQAIHHHMVTAQPAKCLDAMKRGIEVSGRTGVKVLDMLLLNIGAYGSLMQDDFKESEQIIRKISPLLKQVGYFDLANYNCMLLNRDLILKDYPSALRHGRIVYQITTRTKAVIPLVLARIGIAHALFELGKIKEALNHLTRAKAAVSGIRHFKWHALFLFLETHMAFSMKEKEKGMAHLRLFWAEMRKHAYANFLYWRPDVMSDLCARALEAGVETRFVKELIQKRDILPPVPAASAKAWPFPVKIRTLGGFELFYRGRLVEGFKKTHHKQLSLLKAIIALGGSDVPIFQLSDAFWPDSEGDAARRSFDTTLFRLRKLVGIKKAVVLKEGRVSLNPQYCWTDVSAFSICLEKMKALASRSEASQYPDDRFHEMVRLGKEIIHLYRGLFLPSDLNEPWSFSLTYVQHPKSTGSRQFNFS